MKLSDPEAGCQEPLLSTPPVSLVTLSELKCLGQFTRYQEIDDLLVSVDADMPLGYPLFSTRLKPNNFIDVFVDNEWKLVEFISIDNSRLYYRTQAHSQSLPRLDSFGQSLGVFQYQVAPAGLYTAYDCDMSTIRSAKLSKLYKRSGGALVTECEIVNIDEPYVTLKISYNGSHHNYSGIDYQTFHIADPRLDVGKVVPHQPFYNSPIAVSHRWLSESHPDPSGIHFRELMRICENMRLLDCQTFFVDYCSLPQRPRTPDEDVFFKQQLPDSNRHYQKSTIILTQSTDDYESRAWCMFEMILSSVRNAILNKEAVEGKLKPAFDLARSFVEVSMLDFEAKARWNMLPGRGIPEEKFQKWARESGRINLVLHNMALKKRESIGNWFQDCGLKSADMEDIPIIVQLLKGLISPWRGWTA